MPMQRQILHCQKIYDVCHDERIDQALHDTGKGNLYREKTEAVRRLSYALKDKSREKHSKQWGCQGKRQA